MPGHFVESRAADSMMQSVMAILLRSTRETDLVGWYKKGSVLGVIFTEISLESKRADSRDSAFEDRRWRFATSWTARLRRG